MTHDPALATLKDMRTYQTRGRVNYADGDVPCACEIQQDHAGQVVLRCRAEGGLGKWFPGYLGGPVETPRSFVGTTDQGMPVRIDGTLLTVGGRFHSDEGATAEFTATGNTRVHVGLSDQDPGSRWETFLLLEASTTAARSPSAA